eukprot:Gregarina_sp_Poly_1__4920@NODE_260_length_10473_cov_240_642802_g227_i0_p11_GENE_NODE_260_length_10473_cov_240_642802_g227_i0NODE_260_length_10473_cov_240_642802_g227_i0_p11_ORF_typecomplete_len115_score8_79MCCbdg_PDZ/PF10506_9/0_086_NODE_260_length_10473_cov_240_642802_g227_i054455789
MISSLDASICLLQPTTVWDGLASCLLQSTTVWDSTPVIMPFVFPRLQLYPSALTNGEPLSIYNRRRPIRQKLSESLQRLTVSLESYHSQMPEIVFDVQEFLSMRKSRSTIASHQ